MLGLSSFPGGLGSFNESWVSAALRILEEKVTRVFPLRLMGGERSSCDVTLRLGSRGGSWVFLT